MYIKKTLKTDLTFRIKNATINLKKGDIVFIEIDKASMMVKIYQGNLILEYHIKKGKNFFEDEQEDAFIDDVIDEIASQVVKKIETNKKKGEMEDLLAKMF